MDQKDLIAAVAYELYIKSGRTEGRDVENWLEAERIVLSRKPGKAPVAGLKKPPEKSETPAPKKKAATVAKTSKRA